MQIPSRQPPGASEFLTRFFEAFKECRPETKEEQERAWKNWTAFMTGKQGKVTGCWPGKQVLPVTAKKLRLEYQPEFMLFDLVFFPQGNPWGNFVFVEHENESSTFENEVEKLMSVLAPLKVGITYTQAERASQESRRVLELIQDDFGTRHRSILEAPGSEYLFLLGVGNALDELKWKSLLFSCAEGPEGKQFQDASAACAQASL